MLLLSALGIAADPYPSAEELDKIKDELACAAEAFLRAGGVTNSADWLLMGPHEKAAMIYAGNALRDEMAIKMGRCVLEPQYRAALESTYDGGKALDRQSYEEALAQLLAQMKKVSEAMKKDVYVTP